MAYPNQLNGHDVKEELRVHTLYYIFRLTVMKVKLVYTTL